MYACESGKYFVDSLDIYFYCSRQLIIYESSSQSVDDVLSCLIIVRLINIFSVRLTHFLFVSHSLRKRSDYFNYCRYFLKVFSFSLLS